jgi:hypothetical protein
MPDAEPTTLPSTTAGTPELPAAVEAVWSPCPPCAFGPPTESRGETKSLQCMGVPLPLEKASKPALK